MMLSRKKKSNMHTSMSTTTRSSYTRRKLSAQPLVPMKQQVEAFFCKGSHEFDQKHPRGFVLANRKANPPILPTGFVVDYFDLKFEALSLTVSTSLHTFKKNDCTQRPTEISREEFQRRDSKHARSVRETIRKKAKDSFTTLVSAFLKPKNTPALFDLSNYALKLHFSLDDPNRTSRPRSPSFKMFSDLNFSEIEGSEKSTLADSEGVGVGCEEWMEKAELAEGGSYSLLKLPLNQLWDVYWSNEKDLCLAFKAKTTKTKPEMEKVILVSITCESASEAEMIVKTVLKGAWSVIHLLDLYINDLKTTTMVQEQDVKNSKIEAFWRQKLDLLRIIGARGGKTIIHEMECFNQFLRDIEFKACNHLEEEVEKERMEGSHIEDDDFEPWLTRMKEEVEIEQN